MEYHITIFVYFIGARNNCIIGVEYNVTIFLYFIGARNNHTMFRWSDCLKVIVFLS